MRLPGRGRNGSATSPTEPTTGSSRGRLPRKRTRLLGLVVVLGIFAAFTRPGRSATRTTARWVDTRLEGFGESQTSAYMRFLSPFLGRLYRRVADDAAKELTARGLHRKSRIVDVGCGTGELVLTISKRLKDARIVGLDNSPAMLLWANRHATPDGRLRFMSGDASVLPFGDESVDLVVSTLSLHHWDAPADVFAEIARVLGPGGVALIYDAGLLAFTDKEMTAIARDAGLDPTEIVREGVGGGILSRLFVRFRLEGLPEE